MPAIAAAFLGDVADDVLDLAAGVGCKQRREADVFQVTAGRALPAFRPPETDSRRRCRDSTKMSPSSSRTRRVRFRCGRVRGHRRVARPNGEETRGSMDVSL